MAQKQSIDTHPVISWVQIRDQLWEIPGLHCPTTHWTGPMSHRGRGQLTENVSTNTT